MQSVLTLAGEGKSKKLGITIGNEIYLVGYPALMFDPQNTSPLLRMGIIASDPVGGYSFNQHLQEQFDPPPHVDGFIMDANVFPGSSGSMVILRPSIPLSYKDDVVANVLGAPMQPWIMGIAADSIPISDTALGITTRMSIGVAYSAETIRETIAKFN